MSPLDTDREGLPLLTAVPPESYVVHRILALATPDGSLIVAWKVSEQGVTPSPATLEGATMGIEMFGPSVSGRGVLVCVGVLVGRGVLVIVGVGVLTGVLTGVLVTDGWVESGRRQRFWKGS
jgi:hypothetical protein